MILLSHGFLWWLWWPCSFICFRVYTYSWDNFYCKELSCFFPEMCYLRKHYFLTAIQPLSLFLYIHWLIKTTLHRLIWLVVSRDGLRNQSFLLFSCRCSFQSDAVNSVFNQLVLLWVVSLSVLLWFVVLVKYVTILNFKTLKTRWDYVEASWKLSLMLTHERPFFSHSHSSLQVWKSKS